MTLSGEKWLYKYETSQQLASVSQPTIRFTTNQLDVCCTSQILFSPIPLLRMTRDLGWADSRVLSLLNLPSRSFS